MNDLGFIKESCVKYSRGVAFTDPHIARDFVRTRLADLEREVFLVMYLDSQHRLIEATEEFYGTICVAAVYPREIVKHALRVNAAACIFAHNHPGGNENPSKGDIAITERLRAALLLIDCRVLDHLIVGGDEVVSLAERGVI